MATEYHDRWITCTADELAIRSYYFPFGTKHIPYSAIRSVRRVNLGVAAGRARIWGTANPRHWAGLDPQRPSKTRGLVLDLGRWVQPLITPDDPQAVEDCIRAHAGDVFADGVGRAPIM